jgi:hypothetical protein
MKTGTFVPLVELYEKWFSPVTSHESPVINQQSLVALS